MLIGTLKRLLERRLFVASTVAVLIGAIVVVGSRLDGTGAVTQARLWPSFEATYIYQIYDVHGSPQLDQVRRLSVVNEYNWREEVVFDRLDGETGSYREFKGSVLTSYNSKRGVSHTFEIDDGGYVIVNEYLNAGLLTDIRTNRAGGRWEHAPGPPTGATSGRSESYDCGLGRCFEEVRLQWVPQALIGDDFDGGIVRTATRSVNGQVMVRVQLTSLRIGTTEVIRAD